MYHKQGLVMALLLIFILSGSMIFENCTPSSKKAEIISDSTAYVGSNTCKSCHAKEYNDWKISDHFKAMAIPTDSTVLGNFNDQVFSADGVTSKFYKRNGQFIINTQGEDGTNHDYAVKYTFGYFPLQQYLIEFPDGKLQATRLSWDSRSGKWFHQYANQKIPPHDWLHWTGNAQNWNTMCASCHSTNLRKNYVVETDSYHTDFNEINVSCESCHGGGKSHIDYIKSDYQKGNKIAGSLIKIGKGTDPLLQINNCASCHARASSITAESFNPTVHSKELLDHLIPEVPTNDHYFADGQANDEDYIYTSFQESKMFSRGVKCSNCHNPHSGKLIAIGNLVCLNCHAKTYDGPGHSFHQTGTEGAACRNCHMPAKVYMGNDTRYDHTFRVPRPDLSVQYGTPNACNNCHKDKSSKWAADAVVKWYGPKRKYHFSEDLIPGSNANNPTAMDHLIRIMNDTAAPAIIKAASAVYLRNHPTKEGTAALLQALSHQDAQVRYRALKSLADFPANAWLLQAGSLLSDQVRSVRIAAAELYSNLTAEQIPSDLFAAYSAAKQELENSLLYQTDFSVGNIMLGDYYLKQKNYTGAEKFYLRALKKDTSMNYVRFNLSVAYNAQQKNKEAMNILLEAKKIEPNNERIYFNLGLLFNELNDLKQSEANFAQAAALHSPNPRVYYNYGIMLQKRKEVNKAASIFLQGLKIDPNDADLNYALAVLYLQNNQKEKAMAPVMVLKRNYPNQPEYQELFRAF